MSDRGLVRQGLANWRASRASPLAKTGMALHNTWRKLRTGSACCGNHGEPGC